MCTWSVCVTGRAPAPDRPVGTAPRSLIRARAGYPGRRCRRCPRHRQRAHMACKTWPACRGHPSPTVSVAAAQYFAPAPEICDWPLSRSRGDLLAAHRIDDAGCNVDSVDIARRRGGLVHCDVDVAHCVGCDSVRVRQRSGNGRSARDRRTFGRLAAHQLVGEHAQGSAGAQNSDVVGKFVRRCRRCPHDRLPPGRGCRALTWRLFRCRFPCRSKRSCLQPVVPKGQP